eukprot:PhM_4_TR9424/c0_g1_i1/m.100139
MHHLLLYYVLYIGSALLLFSSSIEQVSADVRGPRPSCHSDTNLYASSTLTVRDRTDSRFDMYTFPQSGPKIEIFCLSFQETVSLYQTGTCTESVPWICQRDKKAAADGAWDCEKADRYLTDVDFHYERGSVAGKTDYNYKVQWDPNHKGANCFPRSVQLRVVARIETIEDGSFVAAVVFIIIFALVAIMIGFFAMYQFRKVMGKFWKVEARSGRRVMETLEVPAHQQYDENQKHQQLQQQAEEEEDVVVEGGVDDDDGSASVRIPRSEGSTHQHLYEHRSKTGFQDSAYGLPAGMTPEHVHRGAPPPPIVNYDGTGGAGDDYNPNNNNNNSWHPDATKTVVPMSVLNNTNNNNNAFSPNGGYDIGQQQQQRTQYDYNYNNYPITRGGVRTSVSPHRGVDNYQQEQEYDDDDDDDDEALICMHCNCDVRDRMRTPQICPVSGRRHF